MPATACLWPLKGILSCQRPRIRSCLPERGVRAVSDETVRLKPYNMLFIRSNRFFAAHALSFRLKSSSCWRQYIKINIACQYHLAHFISEMSKNKHLSHFLHSFFLLILLICIVKTKNAAEAAFLWYICNAYLNRSMPRNPPKTLAESTSKTPLLCGSTCICSTGICWSCGAYICCISGESVLNRSIASGVNNCGYAEG